jgi:hypothetical protein
VLAGLRSRPTACRLRAWCPCAYIEPMFLAEAADFVVAPNVPLLLYTLLVLTGVVGSAVTAAKGRWGWFVLDLWTLGLAGNVTAFLAARPQSFWARHRRKGQSPGSRT